MQDIYIDSIRLENVRSHSEMEMDFPVDNFTVIVGKIGAGKSTIFKSVSMALYGDDGGKKGERLSLTDMLPEKNPKNLAIILKFRIIENEICDNYEIRLYQNHSKFKNALYLYKKANGSSEFVDISGETKTATYEFISNLLVPRDVYHNTVYFTQQVKDFFTALTNAEQKDIFDSILSMQEYEIYYKNTDSKLKKLIADLQIILNDVSIYTTKKELISTVRIDTLKRKEEAVKNHALKLSTLKDNRISTENKIEVATISLEMSEDPEVRYATVAQLLSEKEAERKVNITKEDEQKNQIRNEFAEKLKLAISELEIEKSKRIRDQEQSLNTQITEINALILSITKQKNQIYTKYNTSGIEKEINSYKSDKQKEIDTVKFMLLELETEFSIKNINEELENRKRFFVDVMDKVKSKAEDIKSSAKVTQNNIVAIQKIIDDDEKSLHQEVSVCSKCKRPFANADDEVAIRKDIDNNRLKIISLTDEIESYKQQMSKIKAEYEDYQIQRDLEIKNIQERIAHILDKKVQKQEELNRKLILLNEEITEYVDGLNKKIEELNRLCAESVKDLNDKESELNEKSSNLSHQLSDYKTQVESQFTIERDKLTQEHKLNCIRVITDSTKSYNEIIEGLDKNIVALTLEKQTLHELILSQNVKKNALITLNAELHNINEMIKLAEHEIVFDDNEIIKIDSKIEEINGKINSLNDSKIKLEREITILEFWKSAFSDSGIKSMLIDVAIPFMNESVSECLEMAAPGVFTVTFDTLKTTKSGDMKDKFNVNIRHNIKGTSSHKKLSGGEKRLVDIACMHALRGLTEKLYGKRFHNIFYDEVLDALDEDTAEIFCQMSKVMSRDKNVSLITHKLLDHVEPDRCFTI